MMKAQIVVLFLIVFPFCMVGATLPPDECKTGFECSHDKCCVIDYRPGLPRRCELYTDEGNKCFYDLYNNNRRYQRNPNVPKLFKGICACKPGTFCNQTQHVCQALPEPQNRENCKSGFECSHEECCVRNSSGFRHCERLPDEGDECLFDLYRNTGKLTIQISRAKLSERKCPCKPGLFCNQTQHVCQVLPEPSGREDCKTGFECSHDECCVVDVSTGFHHCELLTDEGNKCRYDFYNHRLNIYRPKLSQGTCPCKPGFICNQTQRVCQAITQPDEPEDCGAEDNCLDNQCCVKDFYNHYSKCQPFLQKNNVCFTDFTNHSNNETFTGLCPCSPGSICEKADEVSDPYCQPQ